MGNKVKEYRLQLKLTQEQLGRRVGIHGASISNIERGDHNPSQGVRRMIADALQMPVDDVFPPQTKATVDEPPKIKPWTLKPGDRVTVARPDKKWTDIDGTILRKARRDCGTVLEVYPFVALVQMDKGYRECWTRQDVADERLRYVAQE